MIHVAFAADAAYVPYCAVAMRSVLDHRGARPVTLHLLHGDDLSRSDRDALAGLTGDALRLHHVADDEVAGLPAVDRFGATVWRRLRLDAHLPDVDRVLYLDADTFVVAPLDELWELDLGGRPLAAVANVVEPGLRHRAEVLGLADMRRYFNSGVLLFDLDAVRAGDLLARVTTTARDLGDRLLWPDQDALNVAFADAWHPLHPRWNCMNSLRAWRPWAEDVLGADAVAEALADPAIVHFEGPDLGKPWHYLSSHPLTARYRAALARTPWAHLPLEGRTLINRALKLVPPRWRPEAYARVQRLRS